MDDAAPVQAATQGDVDQTIRTLHAQSRLIDTLQQLAALQQQTIQRLESELAEAKCTMS